MTSSPVHHIQYRVYYEDTDAGGVVYHANYLRWAERARTEWLRALGWNHRQVLAALNVIFVVRHAEIDYKAPARLDDCVDVATSLEAFGNTSFTLRQIVTRDAVVLARLKIVLVAVSSNGKPVRLPPQLRQIFET